MRLKRGTNNGQGWLFVFQDGYRTWALGFSGQEMRNLKAQHGDLVEQRPT